MKSLQKVATNAKILKKGDKVIINAGTYQQYIKLFELYDRESKFYIKGGKGLHYLYSYKVWSYFIIDEWQVKKPQPNDKPEFKFGSLFRTPLYSLPENQLIRKIELEKPRI